MVLVPCATTGNKMRTKFILLVVIVLCAGAMWLFSQLYRLLVEAYQQSGSLTDLEYSWLFRLLLNLAGYSTIMVPGFILYKYLRKSNYFDKISGKPATCVSRALFACFGPYERLPEHEREHEREHEHEHEQQRARRGAELAFCFTGLMAAYLVWGLLQEKIMTQEYVMGDGSAVRFRESQVLVLCNRVGALACALARLWCACSCSCSRSRPCSCSRSPRPVLAAPLYQFSYCALTNVLSAWCQYEALKYVSFPTQVLSKSCKVIPVMLMGKLVSGNKYQVYEYATAALISLGMAMFMFGTQHHYTGGGVGGAGGAVLLALYLCCDSFTSSWQAELFSRYSLHPLQMLAAVNACSVALTAAGELQRAHLAPPLLLLHHPGFLCDVVVLSLSSAVGQLLIYRTIAGFGAQVFVIIMTLRQAVSILISCAVYGHAVSASGALGVALVFAAVLLRVYCSHRARARAQARAHARAGRAPALTGVRTS